MSDLVTVANGVRSDGVRLDAVYARCSDGVVRAFDGPGLLRKPRIGEVLISRTSGRRYVVDRFDSIFPSIVHCHDEQTGAPSSLIWSFGDGLNRLVSHADAERAQVADRKCSACGALCNDPAWLSCHECGHPVCNDE